MQDARWRIVDGKIQLAVPESKGRELDLDRGVASVMAAFLDQETEVKLGVRTLLPAGPARTAALSPLATTSWARVQPGTAIRATLAGRMSSSPLVVSERLAGPPDAPSPMPTASG